MTPKVEREARTLPEQTAPAALAALSAQAVAPLALDPDGEFGSRLPPDHPPWARDVVSLTQRARALLVKLKPVVIRVLAAWEHRVRALTVAGRRVTVDATGSYRVD
jgi:hypothetical protein